MLALLLACAGDKGEPACLPGELDTDYAATA